MKQLKLWKKQLGIFGLFEDDDVVETETEQTRSGTTNVSTRKTGRSETSGSTAEKSTTSLLAPEVQDELTRLLLNNAGDTDQSNQISEIATILFERAQGAEEAINAQTSTIIDAQRRRGESEIDAVVTEFARLAGGTKDNTAVAQTELDATNALNTNLTELEANLALAARETQTNELTSSANLFAAGAATRSTEFNVVNSIAEILKGANVESDTETIAQELSEFLESGNINEIVNELIKGTNIQTDNTTPLDVLDTVSKFF